MAAPAESESVDARRELAWAAWCASRVAVAGDRASADAFETWWTAAAANHAAALGADAYGASIRRVAQQMACLHPAFSQTAGGHRECTECGQLWAAIDGKLTMPRREPPVPAQPRKPFDGKQLGTMRAFAELAPWTTHSLGASPFEGFWPFNPSVVRTPDGRWLCSIRLANYHLPGSGAQPARDVGPVRNRILLATLDPATWQATRVVEVIDRSGVVGVWAPALGFEDLRLVWCMTSKGKLGLCATASAMRLETNLLEIVLLEIDEDTASIETATPLRGPWSKAHQKNHSPYAYDADSDGKFRALFSVLGGGVHDRSGRIVPCHAPLALEPAPQPRGPSHVTLRNGAMDVSIRSGVALPIAPVHARLALRGGSQLVRVEPGRWLGIAHGCIVGFTKTYWSRAYEVNDNGELLSLSEPFKVAPEGIEFVAGMALEPGTGRLVLSYGLEDDSAWLGVTDLDAMLATLRDV